MNRLTDIINSNTTEPKKCLFLTLTYRYEMKDKKQASKDFKAFIQKLKSKKWKEKLKFNSFEYIVVYEIQARKTYHIHAILIFDNPNIFISSNNLESIWEKGFAKAKRLYQNCSNFGCYFTAQFSDIGLCEARRAGIKISEYKELAIEKTLTGQKNGKQKKNL